MRMRLLYALGLLGLAACQPGGTDEATPTASTDPGTLSLPIIGTSPRGDTYRLRDAIFDISGCSDRGNSMYPYPGGYAGFAGAVAAQCTDESLSTEDSPDATSITQRVLPGYYSVSLRDGWRMEKLAGMAWQPVNKVLLLSPSVQNVYVWDHSNSEVRFSFGVDGELIEFTYGDITITIDVRRPDETGPVAGYAGYGGDAGSTGGFGMYPAGSGVEVAGSGVEIAGSGVEVAGSGGSSEAGSAGSN